MSQKPFFLESPPHWEHFLGFLESVSFDVAKESLHRELTVDRLRKQIGRLDLLRALEL